VQDVDKKALYAQQDADTTALLYRADLMLRCLCAVNTTQHPTSNKNATMQTKHAKYYNNAPQVQDDCSDVKISPDMWIQQQLTWHIHRQ